MKIRSPWALAAACLLTPTLSAQVQFSSESPSQVIDDLRADVVRFQLPPVDSEALLAEDAVRGKAGAFRFGVEFPVAWDVTELGTLDLLPDGGRVYRLAIEAPGALSVSLGFSRYDLVDGAGLWIHSADGSETYGAFTAANNKADGQFAVLPMPGDAITVEYVVPAWAERPGELVIDEVVHGYVDVLGKSGYSGGSGGCNIDVNCPVAADFQDEKRAVARTFSGGFLCSGALINNTDEDGTRYFWTANHCGSMNNAVFLFNYESSGCGSGSAPTNQSVQGSVLIANNSSVDYRLVRLTQAIPDNYDVYYLGWNRSSSAPSSTVGIHHPSGDRKKICFDDDAPLKSGTDWRIVEWDLGVTEGGSSGSPLMDPQGRLIGQLCCGQAACGFVFNDYYGRLDLAWSGVSSTLDPAGTGAVTLGGWDPDNPGGGGSGTWTQLGGGVGGLLGMPVLTGSGSMQGGSTATLNMTGALPNLQGSLILGLSAINAPFKDGTMVPSLDLLLGVQSSVVGQLTVSGTWPAGIPAATSIWYQVWLVDFTAPQGYAASNALRGDTP